MLIKIYTFKQQNNKPAKLPELCLLPVASIYKSEFVDPSTLYIVHPLWIDIEVHKTKQYKTKNYIPRNQNTNKIRHKLIYNILLCDENVNKIVQQ